MIVDPQPKKKGKKKWLIASVVIVTAMGGLESLGVIPPNVSQAVGGLLQALGIFG